jgi:hypothetical protein
MTTTSSLKTNKPTSANQFELLLDTFAENMPLFFLIPFFQSSFFSKFLKFSTSPLILSPIYNKFVSNNYLSHFSYFFMPNIADRFLRFFSISLNRISSFLSFNILSSLNYTPITFNPPLNNWILSLNSVISSFSSSSPSHGFVLSSPFSSSPSLNKDYYSTLNKDYYSTLNQTFSFYGVCFYFHFLFK